VAMLCDFAIGCSPAALALSILASTFFLEDAAIGYAALLATTGMIAPDLAYGVLFFGIYAGDLGLYFLGAAARHYAFARGLIGQGRIAQADVWIGRHSLLALLVARVVPGTRLPVYTASGFLHVPFALFAVATAGASLAWTAALFSAIYAFGMNAAQLFGEYKYVAGAVIVAGILSVSILSTRYASRKTCAKHG
jgi:membrane protein DedA with SNARE-associated domain